MNLKRDFLLVFTLIAWSSSSSLVWTIVQEINPILVVGIIIDIATILYLFVFLLSGNQNLLKTFRLREIAKLIIPGFLGIFLYPILYFTAIKGASPLRVNILNYLWPLIAFMVSGLIKRYAFSIYDIMFLIIAAIGAYISLIYYGNIETSVSLVPVLLALLGAIAYGVYTAIVNLFIPRINKESSFFDETNPEKNKMPTSLRMFLMLGMSCMLYIPLFIFYYIYDIQEIFQTFEILKNRVGFVSLYVIVNFSVSYYIWNKLSDEGDIRIMSNMVFLIPVFSTILLSVLSRKELDFPIWISMGLVSISFFLQYNKDKGKKWKIVIIIVCTIIVLLILANWILSHYNVKNNGILNLFDTVFAQIVLISFSFYLSIEYLKRSDESRANKSILFITTQKDQMNEHCLRACKIIEQVIIELLEKEKIDLNEFLKLFDLKTMFLKDNRKLMEQYYLLYTMQIDARKMCSDISIKGLILCGLFILVYYSKANIIDNIIIFFFLLIFVVCYFYDKYDNAMRVRNLIKKFLTEK